MLAIIMAILKGLALSKFLWSETESLSCSITRNGKMDNAFLGFQELDDLGRLVPRGVPAWPVFVITWDWIHPGIILPLSEDW
jgi:hypothetical protein